MPSTTTTSSPVDTPPGVPMTSRTQYDDVADAYDRLIRPKYEPIAARVAKAVHAATDVRRAVVLELSAGTGTLTQQLAPRVGCYVATDVSRPMLDVARGRGGAARVAWLTADVEDLALPSHLADVVVSCLGPVQDTGPALAESRRLVVPGGRFIACTWGDAYTELDLLQEVRRRLEVEPRSTTSPVELAARVGEAGFGDVVVTPFRLPVVHASVAAYRSYRAAFGTMPLPGGITTDQALDTVSEVAASYVDGAGRVVLDWQLLLATARA